MVEFPNISISSKAVIDLFSPTNTLYGTNSHNPATNHDVQNCSLSHRPELKFAKRGLAGSENEQHLGHATPTRNIENNCAQAWLNFLA